MRNIFDINGPGIAFLTKVFDILMPKLNLKNTNSAKVKKIMRNIQLKRHMVARKNTRN